LVVEPKTLRIGTSSFTANGWRGAFYPKGLPEREYLSYYATKFDTIEVDSTFYRTPSKSTVQGWKDKTPDGFAFAAKVPQVITHEKVLVDCDAEFKEFLQTMDLLGGKLGSLLFQFGFFNTTAFLDVDDFLVRLRPFLKKLPKDHNFVVEIRNKYWLVPQFVEVLREHGVALALIDQSWVSRPWEIKEQIDLITADFTYVRLLGDRKAIQQQIGTWNTVIVDRSQERSEWVKFCRPIVRRGIRTYIYCNNHYAGFAPATVESFRELWSEKGLPQQGKPQPMRQGSLFE
jgi:uncharacterized protein YecE (DUF72 family)